jgi:sulfide:quinone oxidoreductase
MVDVREITPEFAVAGQISSADVADLAARGFRSLICNRPDDESWGQPDFASIAAAAKAAGLEAAYVPVVSGRMTPADVDAFRTALGNLPAPTLAYCRSGARSLSIYTAAKG